MTQPSNDPAAPLLLFEHATDSGHRLAEARLNSEATLNALSLPMIDILHPALERWAGDDRVVAVLLTGAGERAFSAGGDVQALYRAMLRNHQARTQARQPTLEQTPVDDYPYRFFEAEYRLDYRLHTFPKPVLSLGHGVVMGGGLGVFSGARYRVVTENTRVAMPEVSIGLFPDAGATWLLAHLPRHLATFLAMTGAPLNATDALAAGVAGHCVATAARGALADALRSLPWQAGADDHDAVEHALRDLPGTTMPDAQTGAVPSHLEPVGTLQDTVQQVRALAGRSAWIDAGIEAMNRGCPTSVGLVVRQLTRAPGLGLADTFRMEMIVATHCANHPDFAEGVRARIIDKDNAPNWRYPTIEALPQAYVDEHFRAPWARNPLEDLEEETS